MSERIKRAVPVLFILACVAVAWPAVVPMVRVAAALACTLAPGCAR